LNAAGTDTIMASEINNGSTDNCGVGTTVINMAIFGCANVGLNVVTLTVTDVNGNTSTCNANVTVRDVTAPVANCQNITLNLNASGTGNITAAQVNNSSTDACGIGPLSLSANTFGCAQVGNNGVTLIVSDVNGNTATCNANVFVRDLVAPTAVCQNLTVNLTASGNAVVTAAQINNGSTDACGVMNLSTNVSGFGCPQVGSNNAVLTVTDVNGNTATCSATILIQDVTPPSATCQPVTINLNASGVGTVTGAQVNNNSTDACGIGTLAVSPGSFGCNNVGANTVTLTVTDVNNNTATCTAAVTVVDVVAPTAVCQNLTVNLNASGAGTITAAQLNNGSADACGIGGLSASMTSFDCSNVGSSSVTLTVTDVNGNTATCSATVLVRDLVAPVAICQNVTAYLSNTGTVFVNTNSINNGSSDACGISSFSLNTSSFSCPQIGSNMVTLSVTDVNNNTSTCTASVQVLDSVRPIVACQPWTVFLNAQGAATVTPQDIALSNSDNCGVPTLSLSTTTFGCNNLGNNTVVLTSTDGSNNASTCSAIVSVNDSLPPIINLPPPPPPSFADPLLCGANVTWTAATAGDNCSVQTLTSNYSPGDLFPIGNTMVIYTATDIQGNVTIDSFMVTVDPTPIAMVTSSPVLGCGFNLACASDTNATATVSVTGGCLPYGYLWSTGDTTQMVSNLGPGTYWVTVTDGRQVMQVDSITIIAPSPLQVMLTGDTVVCDGLSDGNLQAMVTGGQACLPYSYQWSNGGTQSSIAGLDDGTYIVTVTDNLGCSMTDTASLAFGALPVLELGNDTLLCPGAILLFEAPSIYASYLWNDGSTNSTILITQTGTYILEVWTAQGCTDNDTILFDEHFVDYDIITPMSSLTICDGDTLNLVGDSGLTGYDWSTGDTTSSTIVAGFGGLISLEATDSNGCHTEDSVMVNYAPIATPNPIIVPGPNAVLCDGGTLQLDVQLGYFSYDWSTGANTQSITISSPGVYDVTVSNGFGCTKASAPVSVTVGQLPTPTIIVGTTTLSTGAYASYQWMLNGNPILGAILQEHTPVVTGDYSVMVTDSNGCTGTSAPVFFNAVGVADQVDDLQGLQIYPNPTSGIVNLRTLNPIDWPIEVEVWDMFGQRVKKFNMAHLMDVTVFDLSDLAAAPYMMKITTLQRNRTLQATFRVVID
jgi:HYR domain/Secretion system C-terminal sorting domain/SprB repeat